MVRPLLTPAQQAVREGLLDMGGDRPTFRADLAADLQRRLHEATAAVAERLELTAGSVWVDKRALAGIHGCERRFEAERAEGFPGWSTTLAKGTIVHRALQLAPFLNQPASPLAVVNLAIERIVDEADDRSPAQWLQSAAPGELAELRAAATDVVTKFEETFPPIVAAWRPRIESQLRHEVHRGTITLGARPDLALGRPDGHMARVLIVDLKTGQRHHGHLDDLRFYALVETLRLGVPPFRVATFYLDTARWEHEDISEQILEVAVRRTIDGAIKLAELQLREREPTFTPGPPCAYCVVRDNCEGPSIYADGEA